MGKGWVWLHKDVVTLLNATDELLYVEAAYSINV